MKHFGLISLMLCLCLCSEAQIRILSRETLDSVADPKLSDRASVLSFDMTTLKAEPMNEDDSVCWFSYPFENVGKDTLTVGRLVSTCSCAAAVCIRSTVPPGERSEIRVKYNPKGHPGSFERKVMVYLEGDEAPSAVLKLEVNVERGSDLSGLYPISMGNIRLRRTRIELNKGVRAVERCVVMNVSDKPLKLDCEKFMLPPCLSFEARPATLPSGAEGEIIVSYDPGKGGERERIPVILKGLGLPPSQSTITVEIK